MYRNILILPDGSEAQLRSLKLREMVNSAADLTIGACCSDLLEATVFADALPAAAGEDVALWKEKGGSRIPMGIYTLEAPTRLTEHTWRLTGYDHGAKLDKDLTPWLRSLTGWPYSLQTFAQMVCQACGVEYEWSETLPNEEFLIPKWSESAVTGRKIMSWLGEITCRFVHADPQGRMGFSWYEDSGKTLTPTGETYYLGGSLRISGYQIAPVEAVQLQRTSGLFPEAEAGANSYILTGNPILSACKEEILLPLLENILTQLRQVSYTPGTVAAVADPAVRAGSILHVEGQTLYIMEKVSAGQRDTFTCTGNPRRDSVTALHSKSQSQKAAEAALQTDARLTPQALFGNLPGGAVWEGGSLWLKPEYLLPGELRADLKIFPGEAVVVDALPEKSEPGRLYLLRTQAVPGYIQLQPYLGCTEERNAL